MAMYQLRWQHSKNPKDKTGIELVIDAMDDFTAGCEADALLTKHKVTEGNAFFIHFKECNGRTLYYYRGF